ncbi:MAG TPA: transporter [Methylomirabilota bacterium]
MPIVFLVLVLLAFQSMPALAAQIEPDRPELTESAKLVPRGSVQLETGVAYSKERRAGEPAEKTLELEADLRIGLTRQLEVDLEGEPFVRVRGPQDDTGVGDITIGFRYRFIEAFEDYPWPPHLAVKAFAKLPIADEPIDTERPNFGLLLLASFDLPWDFELEVNLGAAAIGQTRPNGYLAQALGSASLSHDLTTSLFGFLELLLASRDQRDGRGSMSINVGLVYRVTSRLAVDAGIQTSLLGEAPDYVARAGLSVRWGR